MAGGFTVQLALGNQNKFQWIATNQAGVSMEFTGGYSMKRGTLKLVRRDNREKLAGEVSEMTDEGFRFRPFAKDKSEIVFSRK